MIRKEASNCSVHFNAEHMAGGVEFVEFSPMNGPWFSPRFGEFLFLVCELCAEKTGKHKARYVLDMSRAGYQLFLDGPHIIDKRGVRYAGEV